MFYVGEYYPSHLSEDRQAEEHFARIREQEIHGDTWAGKQVTCRWFPMAVHIGCLMQNINTDI